MRATPGFVYEDRGYVTPCRVWTGARGGSRNAYGVREVGGVRFYVHRRAWEDAFGPIPPDKEVCHHCDVGLCAEPSHLFLGTHAENMADMDRKQRRRSGFPGEAHHNAKLTDELVRVIRASREAQGAIAARLGVAQTTVGRIRRGEAWRHVI